MDPLEFESALLHLMFKNDKVRDRVIPFLDHNVFEKRHNKLLVRIILKYQEKYQRFPNVPELKLLLNKKGNPDAVQNLDEILNIDTTQFDDNFIKDELQEFYRKKLIFNTIAEATASLDGSDNSLIESCPDKLRDALAFSFDTEVGLDFLESAEDIYEHIHSPDIVVSTALENLDGVIKGGYHNKTLTLYLAETNLGKSLIMCSQAIDAMMQNKKVLYVTLEMEKYLIAMRYMANLFDKTFSEIESLSKPEFLNEFNDLKRKIEGNILVKDYPTGSANTNHIRYLVKELVSKKKFKPDIIFVDYLGIMATNKSNSQMNSYTEEMTKTKELRALSHELDLPIISAVQTNRKGFNSAQIDLTDIADSIGTAANADIIIGVTQTEELREVGLYNYWVLKNRYGLNRKKLTIGVNYEKMRVYYDKETMENNVEDVKETVDKNEIDEIMKKTFKENHRKKISDDIGIDFD